MKTLNTVAAPVQARANSKTEVGASAPLESLDDVFLPAVVIGVVEAMNRDGVWINYPGNLDSRPILARSAVPFAFLRAGAKVTLAFVSGDSSKPVLLGLLHDSPVGDASAFPLQIEMDGERLVFTAQKEIVLRCGKASIQLLGDGSVRIRGTEVLNRASGTNRIRGGNVQIN